MKPVKNKDNTAVYKAAKVLDACDSKEEYLVWCDLHEVDPDDYFSRFSKVIENVYMKMGLRKTKFTYDDFYRFETIPGAAKPNALDILKRFI